MVDKEKPFTVTDRRRVDERGRPRERIKIPGKTDVQFKAIGDPLDSAFRYFHAQVERLPGRGWPRSGEVNDLLRGFVTSTHQLYAATILLMADDRPKPLILPAGIVARSLVEGLGNVLAILDAPATAPALFRKDDYLNTYKKAGYHRGRFGSTPGYKDDARKLAEYGRDLKLTEDEIANPEKLLAPWPAPGRLLSRDFLAGERRQVFEEIHGFWYRSLSALSHHRIAALQVAVFTEERPNEETFVMVKSVTASLAIVVALCVLSEVEAFCGLEPSPPLRAAWERVRSTHDIVTSVYRIRYARLLKMEVGPTP